VVQEQQPAAELIELVEQKDQLLLLKNHILMLQQFHLLYSGTHQEKELFQEHFQYYLYDLLGDHQNSKK
jgi:hypothetical protein